jgi:hypothetical protein
VEIQKPYNEKEFLDDKLTVVDVKARDATGQLYQVEVQLDADALPAWMQTQETRRAMNTLKAFSEKEHAYHAYQARQDSLREQQSIQLEFDDLRAEVEQARAEAGQERAAKEEALAENERLCACSPTSRNRPTARREN